MDDLKGVYVMVNFRQAPIGKETVWEQQFPYQYLAFYPGHIFAMVAVAREIRDPAKLSSYMNAQYQSLKQKFFPDDAGHLLFLRPMQTERYQCVAAGSTRGEYKKGDLILTRTDDKEGSDVYKLYRRWY